MDARVSTSVPFIMVWFLKDFGWTQWELQLACLSDKEWLNSFFSLYSMLVYQEITTLHVGIASSHEHILIE